MADVTELRMNVAALKRVDPYAKDIVDSATHVALYTFEDNEWEKTSIEGALFVYSRNGEPYHSMLIMNRLNTNNLIEPVTQGLELQLQEPFLLYRNSRCHIYGIWFYEKDECVRVATKLNSLVKDFCRFPGSENMSQKQQLSSIPSASVDIFSMLSKAQDDYNTNKGSSKMPNNKGDIQAPRAPDVTSQSVMDFFAKAGSGSTQMSSAQPPQSNNLFGVPIAPPPDVREGPLLFQRLMSNPVHSVEHIEKQQRSVTPQDLKSNGMTNVVEPPGRSNNGFKLKAFPDNQKRAKQQTSKQNSGPVGAVKVKPLLNMQYAQTGDSNGQSELEQDLSFVRISSPKSSSPIASFFSQSQSVNIDDMSDLRPLSAPVNNVLDTPQKPALMPPTMFTSSVSKSKPEQSTVLNNFLTPIKRPTEDLRPEPLTRNQFLQAFTHLIKHDADFVNKLHEAYVKSFSELVS